MYTGIFGGTDRGPCIVLLSQKVQALVHVLFIILPDFFKNRFLSPLFLTLSCHSKNKNCVWPLALTEPSVLQLGCCAGCPGRIISLGLFCAVCFTELYLSLGGEIAFHHCPWETTDLSY